MALSKDQVRYIAHLARLKLSEAEVEKFTKQLDGVLSYMDILNEVNTDNTEETSQVTGLSNVLREDEVKNTVYEDQAPEFLNSSPFPIERRQIKVPGVFE